MRVITIALTCLAGLEAVQATSFVTVIKTVIEDSPVASTDFSTPALDHKPFSDVAKIVRRDEDGSPEEASVTQVYITPPITTLVQITVQPHPADNTESQEDADEEGWEEVKETVPVMKTITRTPTPAGNPVGNTGKPNPPPKPSPVSYTAIPENWPPTLGPSADPYGNPPSIPNIVNVGYVTPTKSTEGIPTHICDIYPYPEESCDDPEWNEENPLEFTGTIVRPSY